MSPNVRLVWIGLLLALLGCGAEKPMPEGAEPTAGPAAAHEDEHAEEQENLLMLDAEVLRDLRLTTFPAELRPAGDGVTALGELRVDEESYAEVGSPIAARVVRLIAQPGQAVRRGQPLAELQSVELGQARAERIAAAARADLARQTVERKRTLAAERIVSRGDLQRAEAEAAGAEAELRAAEAAVAALGIGDRGGRGGNASLREGDLSGFALLAPISGTVLERTAVRGQSADPSRALFRIADLARVWLVVQAPEHDVARIRSGAAAEIALAALPEQKLRGTVDQVGREVDAHSRTVPVRIVLSNPDGRLKPGMFATAWISTGGVGEQVVAVPAAALQRLENRWVVFLPADTGRFEVRPVERGRDLGGEVAVLSGLRPGERVVDEGAFVLRAEAEKGEGESGHHH